MASLLSGGMNGFGGNFGDGRSNNNNSDARGGRGGLSPALSSNSSGSLSVSQPILQGNARFTLFLKILLRTLSQSPELQISSKIIVSECVRRNRLGDPDFSPLMGAITTRLRLLVGEEEWKNVCRNTGSYFGRQSSMSQDGIAGVNV